jgi:short chain dehydrogenase
MRIAALGAGGMGEYDGALISRGDDPPTDEGASQLTSSLGKTAMITGASRGLGRAVASRLARDDFAVVVNYAGSTANAERAVAEIQAAGGRGRAWTDHTRAATGT